MPDSDENHSSSPPRWLTSELMIKSAGVLITLVGLYYGISTKVDRLSEDVKEIRQALPNKELDAKVIEVLTKRLDTLESEQKVTDTWIRTTREKLAERGWKVDQVP